jgi:hypothetical protein
MEDFMAKKSVIELKNEKGEYPAYAWPGGYPIMYVCNDGGVLCPTCMNAEREQIEASIAENANDGWNVIASDINYEDPNLFCDNCNKQIECAYGAE